MARIAGAWAAAMSVTLGLTTLGFIAMPGWIPAFATWTLLHAIAAFGLFARRRWGVPFAQGLGLFGTVLFVCTGLQLGPLFSILLGLAENVALLGLTSLLPTPLGRRHAWAIRLASMALSPTAGFALAPEQSGAAAVVVLGGAVVLGLAAMGVARGRTWGLLACLTGASLLAAGLSDGASVAHFSEAHFLVGQPLRPLALRTLGLAGVACGVGAWALFAWPILRFVQRPN